MSDPEHVDLTAAEREVLDDIERSLASVDPRLAARLAHHRTAGGGWEAVRLPVGLAATAGGLAGMVAGAVSGELGLGLAAVPLAAAGLTVAADAVREKVDRVPNPFNRRRRSTA